MNPPVPIQPDVAKALTDLVAALGSIAGPETVKAFHAELSSRLADGVPVDVFGLVADLVGWMLAKRDGLLRPAQRAWLAMRLVVGSTLPVHLELARLSEARGRKAEKLADALADKLSEARVAFGMDKSPPVGPEACREAVNAEGKELGLLWLDELAASFIESIGELGRSHAQAWREDAAARWSAAHDPSTPEAERPPADALWRLWLPTEQAAGASPFALGVALCLWSLGVATIELVETGDGRRWGKATSAVAGMAWAMGGHGKLEDTHGAPSVVVDGSRYVEQPATMGRYVSGSALLLNSGRKGQSRTVQLRLDLSEPPQKQHPLALYVANLATLRGGRGGEIVSPTIGKVLLLMLASERGRISVRDLARLAYPRGTRIERSKHMVEVSKALWLAKGLHAVTPEDLAVPMFTVTAPANPEAPRPDAEPSWDLTPRFRAEFVGAGTRTPGWLLLCWTALLGLGPRQGPELRAYVRAADLWNRCRVPGGNKKGMLHSGRIPEIPANQWVAEVNELPPGAVTYANKGEGSAGQRVEKARATERALGALEELEARGMIGEARIMGRGQQRSVQVLPPPELAEAYRKLRAGEGAPAGLEVLKPEKSSTKRKVRRGRGKSRDKTLCE